MIRGGSVSARTKTAYLIKQHVPHRTRIKLHHDIYPLNPSLVSSAASNVHDKRGHFWAVFYSFSVTPCANKPVITVKVIWLEAVCWVVSVEPWCSVPRCVVSALLPSHLHILNVFPPAASLLLLTCLHSAFSPCVCVCCLGEGLCDSGPVTSDVWVAKGGVIPYFSAPPAPSVRRRRPRLLLPPLSPRLLPLSLCRGLFCLTSFHLSSLPSVLPFTGNIYLQAVYRNQRKKLSK